MKIKILILEDNYYKYFTTKQLIENQLKVSVKVKSCKEEDDLINYVIERDPNLLIYRPVGGVVEILNILKERGINRRNAVVELLLTTELSREICEKVALAAHKRPAAHLASIARAA